MRGSGFRPCRCGAGAAVRGGGCSAPDIQVRLRAWWATLVDRGHHHIARRLWLCARTALVSEIAERLRTKLLPGSPETIDASELFMLALPSAFDAPQWHSRTG